jgi:hypothetical protein
LICDIIHLNWRTTLLKTKGQSGMDNSETSSTLDKRHEWRQTNRKHRTQKTKKMSNRDLNKTSGVYLYGLNFSDTFWISMILSEPLCSELLWCFLNIYDLNFNDICWTSLIFSELLLNISSFLLWYFIFSMILDNNLYQFQWLL